MSDKNIIDENKLLEQIAEAVSKQYEIENEEAMKALEDVPEYLDKNVFSIIEQLEKENSEQRKKLRRKTALKAAAILIVCTAAFNVVALSVSEAYRSRFFNFIYNDESGSVKFLTENEESLLADWNNYWYPEYLPEGYYLHDAINDIDKTLIFLNNNGNSDIFIRFYNFDTNLTYNSDDVEIENVKVGQYDGILFVNQNYNYTLLTWLAENQIIEIKISESTDSELILKIAESMKFIK